MFVYIIHKTINRVQYRWFEALSFTAYFIFYLLGLGGGGKGVPACIFSTDFLGLSFPEFFFLFSFFFLGGGGGGAGLSFWVCVFYIKVPPSGIKIRNIVLAYLSYLF